MTVSVNEPQQSPTNASIHLRNEHVSAAMELITAHINRRNFQAASQIVNRLIKKHPTDDRLHIFKAIIYSAEQRLSNALSACKKAVELAPSQYHYLVTKGELELKLNDLDSARNTLVAYLDEVPDDTKALRLIAAVFEKQKEGTFQLISLLRLAGVSELTSHEKTNVFQLLTDNVLQTFSPSIIDGLIAILNYTSFDTIGLSQNVSSYIAIHYKMQQANPSINLQDIYEDKLLITALPIIRIVRPEVERFLTSIREALLITALTQQNITQQHLTIIRAVAQQYNLNEFVSYVSENEENLLAEATKLLTVQIKAGNWSPQSSEAILLLLSMYKNLYELPHTDIFLTHTLEEWPQSLQDIAKKSLFDITMEIQTASHIPTLGIIENSVSLEVQDQYENNPYPRWKTFHSQSFESIGKVMTYLHPSYKHRMSPELFQTDTCILIAGGGAGQQPISCAKNYPYSQITSVDISKRSLAYGKIKAQEMQVNNIDFFHADILDLPNHFQPFHYVECCGVLHHMEDPKLGWETLLKLLIPGGFMKVALYSEMARKDISKEREKIRKIALEPTPQNIRRYRKVMLEENTSPILKMFLDFYNLSECRDLLFHQHEKCYTWPMIAEHCQDLGAEFVGLAGHSSVTKAFEKQYPSDGGIHSLEDLHKYELSHPYAFRTMYQFLVHKPLN